MMTWRSLCGIGLCGALSGCVIQLDNDEVLTSLRIVLREPQESALGREGQPITASALRFDVQAIGPDRQIAPRSFSAQAFLTAGGSRLSLRNPCGGAPEPTDDRPWLLADIPLVNGQAGGIDIPLSSPLIFGQVSLAIEDRATRAAGATPPIFLPNPTISGLMKPLKLDAVDASYCTPFYNRQIVLDHGTGTGKLVVSSVFSNAYAVTDTGASEYRSIYVFTFSRPPSIIRKGQGLTRVAGAISQFNKFVQIANPSVKTDGQPPQPGLVPTPVELTAAMRPKSPANSAQNQELIRHIASPVTLKAKVCRADNDPYRLSAWQQYSTLVLSFDDTDACDNRKTFSLQLPGRGFACLDPAVHGGKEFTFTGMLQNGASNSGLLFWTVVVRDTNDISPSPCSGG